VEEIQLKIGVQGRELRAHAGDVQRHVAHAAGGAQRDADEAALLHDFTAKCPALSREGRILQHRLAGPCELFGGCKRSQDLRHRGPAGLVEEGAKLRAWLVASRIGGQLGRG
jgi:hypothetical protein